MKFISKHYKLYLYMFICIIAFLFITSTLYYFNIINNTIYEVLSFIIIILVIFISSIKVGLRSDKNAYLEGFKFSMLIIVLITTITLLAFKNEFELRTILYDIIIIITSMLGSMIGINKKK